MKYYIFFRDDNKFDDILQDSNIKNLFNFKIRYNQHLILGSESIPEEIQSYIMLKYGDDLRDKNSIFIDRTPKAFLDYIPDSKRPDKFKKL
jgi:hypothetical protein